MDHIDLYILIILNYILVLYLHVGLGCLFLADGEQSHEAYRLHQHFRTELEAVRAVDEISSLIKVKLIAGNYDIWKHLVLWIVKHSKPFWQVYLA